MPKNSESLQPMTQASASASAPAQVKYQAPAGWSETPPGQMGLARFAMANNEAELSVMSFPGEGASQLNLVNIVRENAGLPALNDADLAKLVEPVDIGGEQGSLINLTGSTGSTKNTASNSIVVAVLGHGGATWFFKMSGSSAAVAAQRPELVEFLKSVSFTAGSAPASPHGEQFASANTGRVPPVAAPPADDAASGDKPSWTVPANWREVPPTEMLLAKFVVGGKDGEGDVTVSMFPGDVGGPLRNINRWRGQVGLEATDEAALAQAYTSLDVPGGKAMLVDVSGKNKSGKNTRLVGVIWPRNGQTWFYKLMGDTTVAGGEKDNFLKFVQSARYPNG